MKKIFGLLALAAVFGAAGIARADIAPPANLNQYKLDPQTGRPPEPAGSARLAVVQSSDIDVIHLQIPRSVLNDLQAKGGPTAANTGLTPPATRTLFAGVFLSFALAFGGVWLLRTRNSPAARVAAMLLIAVAMAGTATTAVWANAGPPGRVIYPPGTLPNMLKHDPSLDGTVLYEVSDGDTIELLIPTREIHRSK